MTWPGGGPLLADTSAWSRIAHCQDDWLAGLDAERIVICPIVHLELLYSARTGSDVERLDAQLTALRNVPIGRATFAAASSAVTSLAARGSDGHHRVAPPDAIIAACAAEHGCAVLHYDAHFDRLATVLDFESIWVVSRGSVP